MASLSADGSLDTQQQRKKFSLTPEDLENLNEQQPTDMSGKPLLPKKGESIQTLNRIYKENQALKAEKKKYADVFDKQLNVKPKVEESQYLKDRLSSINTELINQTEESVVPELQYQFGDLGFNFETAGYLGDYVKVTSPDGKKTTEISLDNFLSSKSKAQSEVLQKFIKDNTPAKGLFVLEKTMREQDKKFNSEKQVDESVKVISNQLNALNAKQKQFLIKKSQFEKELNSLGPTAELEQQRLTLNEEMKSILQEEETIKQKSKILDTAVGKYSLSKSKQGTWGGAIWNAINEGASSISAGTTSLITDIATEIAPAGFGMSPKDLKDVSINIAKKIGVKEPSAEQTIEQWKETLTKDQLDNWEDEVDDYIKKDIKSRALPSIRIGNREIFGDADTTKQFSDLKEKGFWGGAILGLSKSLPAMIGGAGPAGWAQRTAQMYSQVSDGLAVEMENDPDFKDVSENEKLAITLPIGIVGAVLENVGLKNIKGSQGIINSIALKALGKAGKGVTAKTFRELVENEVETAITRGALVITAAGAAEFETGAAQELADTGFKALYNEIKGKEMFDTPDSIEDLIENVAVAGAQEAIGGFVLGVPSGVSAAYSEKGFLKMDDASFETFANIANDDKMQSAYIASLKDKITQGVMTEKDAKEELNNYRNSAGLFRSLPEGLSTQQKKEAMNLLKEKKDLDNYVEGKDPALVVKSKNRITEINNELTKLSETDAIQEQSTTEVPVQSEAGISETVAERISEPKPEVVTEQATQEVTPSQTITTAQEVVGIPDEISQPIELSVAKEVTPVEDFIKVKKSEDFMNDAEHIVTLNGKEAGRMYYDRSSKAWKDPNFDRSKFKPESFERIYGDILGETKQEATDELIKRTKESIKKEAPVEETVIEEPRGVQFTKDTILNKFLNQLNTLNPIQRNPIDNKSFVYGDKASLEFNRFDKGDRNEISLESISSMEKGKGLGKDTMSDVLKTADDLGVTITLDAKPFGREGLSKKELIDFYKKNGFEVDQQYLENLDFNSEQEAIDYVLENESEALPMTRKPQSEVTPSEVDDLLDLDTTDPTSLQRVLDYLDGLDTALDLDPNELNEVTRVMAIATAKAVVKALKVLVNAGITLQEAIKQVADEQNLKVSDIVKGVNALSEISKIATGYNELMAKADKLIVRQKKQGISDKKIISNLDTMVRNFPTYTDEKTNDAQRKIMEREARAKMGVAPRKAPSIGRVLGVLNDIKNVSREEKLKIISRIRELSKDAVKDLIEEIKELAKGGKITPTQSINIISKFGKVNMLNEISVSNFVDYMAKVFNDADYGSKINVAKKKLKNAKKNIDTKIGIANGLAFPLKTLFSINPSLIPIKNLERYIELVDMFSERKAVLQLDEISQVISDVNEILDEIDNELSVADELSFRLNYSDNKIIEDGKLDYAATIKNMLKKGEITQEEAEIMAKYKSEIIPQVEKSKKSDEELQQERDDLIKDVKKSTVNSSDLPTRDERSVAKRISEYLKTPFIKELSNSELKNLLKGIDNINNGYLPHQVELILEKLDSLSKGNIVSNSIEKANLKTIGQLVNTVYNKIKSKITGKDVILEMIQRTPLFNIDQILGDFKTEDLYYALLGASAKAEAKFSFELKTIQDKLQKAQDKIAKSEGYFKSMNPLKAKISNYKIRTYQLQLENDSNPGDNRVNPAAEYIKATIKHIKKLESQYNENDVKILEDILKEFAPDGQIDIDKLYNSFNSAEKDAIKTFQEIKKFETEMAEFTGAVIRGKRIIPLNNHTHISVLSDTSKEDLDVGVSFANEYNDSLKPSTKAKNLMERTPGAKPINFDAYSTALKSVKYVLMDYHLTTPIRTARKSIKVAEAELEKNGEMSEEKRRIFNAVNKSFELAVSDLVMNSYVQTSFTQDVVNFISKQGYRAVLAGLGKSSVELLSNFGFVVTDPFTFYKGVEHMGILLSEDGPAIMNNSKSIQTPRVFAAGLSGRMLDLGILDQSVGTKSSKTRGKIINKAQQVWNLTGKKFIKNPVELTADALISSPDKVIMRPYWLGSYITELEKQLGRKVTKEDLKKIAENNEQYMNENESAIEAATRVADRKSKLMGATKNGFAGLLKGKARTEDNPLEATLKNFNSFMTNFMVYEFNAAKTGVAASIGQGTMTKKEGAAVLAGVVIRMTVYNLLMKSVTAGVSGLLGLAVGFEDDEEEEEKTVDQLLAQSLASTFASLMLGRDFGNVSKTFINYGFEEYVTKEYLDGLRTGEYDPYKDSVLFNSLQTDEKTGELKTWENIPNFMGSYGPAAKTVALAVKTYSEEDKKTAKALDRQEKERTIRVPLEIMGNLGYIPLYKEIRKAVMDDIYKDLKTKKPSIILEEEEGEDEFFK